MSDSSSPPPADPDRVWHPLVPAVDFSAALLPRVAGFDCGQLDYEKEVADWLKAPRGSGGAADAVELGEAKVWLYETTIGELVGYGSLGVTHWRHPNPKKSPKIAMHIIPFFGVRTEFRGRPPGERKTHYSSLIFNDLLARALDWPDKHRWLVLCVDAANVRAINFYRDEFNFAEFGEHKGKMRMILDLRPSS